MKRLFLFLLASCGAVYAQQNAVMLPWTPQQFTNTNGTLLVSGKVCTYLAGTSTGTATFTDATAAVQNAIPPNAILLDSTARPISGGIWLTPNKAYKIVTMTAGSDQTCNTGVVVRTQDNVTVGVASTTNNTFSGTNAFTGLVAASNLDNSLMACSTSVLFTYQTISAALTALPGTGGTVQVCAGHTETLAANIAITKANTIIQFLGKAQITLGAFQVTVASGSTDVSIIGPSIRSHVTAGTCQGACFDGYTGTGAAISIGDSSGFTENFNITGIGVGLGSAGAGAQAFLFTNVISSKMNDLGMLGGPVSGQIGYKFLGTGAFFAGLDGVLNPDCNYNVSATNGICIQTAALANAITVVGGHGNMGGSANGSVCLDALAGNGLYSYSYDCDIAAQALTVESTTDGAFAGYIRIDSGVSGNANWATFAASSRGNWVQFNANPAGKITDSGVAGTNSVIYSDNFGWRTDKWQINAGAANFLLTDIADAYAPIALSVGSPTKISSQGTNDLQLNPNGGNGVSIFNNANTFKHTFTSVATANRAITLQDSGGSLPVTPCTTSQRTETAADANLLTCAIPAQAGSYRLRFMMNVSATNAATIGWTATYTDSNGVAQAPTNMALNAVGAATWALTANGNNNYYGYTDIDVNNSGTAIVIKVTFSGTSFTAKCSATVERII